MDYDSTEIPENYDRGRDHGAKVLDLWMDIVSQHVEPGRIKTVLDLGCGTGRFSEALAARFGADVIGVDPSQRMLAQAERKKHNRRVRYVLAHAEALPLKDCSVDLVFMSMVFHHFDHPLLAARECRRVLRDGATAFLRAGIRERRFLYPYVKFFPQTVPILEECLTSAPFVRETFARAGFRATALQVVTQEIASSYAAYAEKLSWGADSVLIRLSPGEFDAGMNALRTFAARNDGESVFEPIEVLFFNRAATEIRRLRR